MKKCFWFFVTFLGLTFMACSETLEIGEFEGDWDKRNYSYIDSLATVARANIGNEVGQWKVMRTYKQNESEFVGSTATSQDFIYAKIVEKGNGTESPLFTDSVQVHYRGRLIPTVSYPEGKVFDQNFYGELDSESAQWAPSSTFACNVLVEGWSTALMYMHEGDYWRLYIPEDLGYKTKGSDDGSVPGYSTLIFDIYLQKIKKAAH